MLINNSAKGFNLFKSICNCIDGKSSRDYLNLLHVTRLTITGTNGKVLGTMNNIYNIPDGYHKVVKNYKNSITIEPSDEKCNYPKYQNVLVLEPESQRIIGMLTGNVVVDNFKIARIGTCIDPLYLSIFDVEDQPDDIVIYVSKLNYPLHLHSAHGFKAAIMHVEVKK